MVQKRVKIVAPSKYIKVKRKDYEKLIELNKLYAEYYDPKSQKKHLDMFHKQNTTILILKSEIDEYKRILQELMDYYIEINKSNIQKNKGLLAFEKSKIIFWKNKRIENISPDEVRLFIEIVKEFQNNKGNGITAKRWVEIANPKQKTILKFDEDTLKTKVFRLTKRNKYIHSIIKFQNKMGLYIENPGISVTIIQ